MKNSIKKKKIGSKNDIGKVPVTQLLRQFPNAIMAISQVSEYGHKKYGKNENKDTWDNWKHVEDGLFRYKQAAGRHFLEPNGSLDPESGFPHIYHTVWNLLACLEISLTKK